MAERTIFSCDVCGTEQQQTNHWFAIVIMPRTEGGDTLLLAGLGSIATGSESDQLFHLCGEACVIRKVNEYLGAKK